MILKYDLFKKRSYSGYFTSSGYLYNVKVIILNQSKKFYIQLKRTTKSLKYVSPFLTISFIKYASRIRLLRVFTGALATNCPIP